MMRLFCTYKKIIDRTRLKECINTESENAMIEQFILMARQNIASTHAI
jgi:hypothetical protein